jgi:hypothetical protein
VIGRGLKLVDVRTDPPNQISRSSGLDSGGGNEKKYYVLVLSIKYQNLNVFYRAYWFILDG